MAIITIPSSIGGVTIPGGIVSGPLGALFGKSFDQKMLQYPRDLQSATKGHVVHFTINEVKPLTYEEDVRNSNIVKSVEKSVGLLGNAISDLKSGKTLLETAKDLNSSIRGSVTSTKSDSSSESTILNFQPRRTTTAGHIFLYMPDTVNFQYGVAYETPSLMDVGGNFIRDLIPGSRGETKKKNILGKAGAVAGRAGTAVTSATGAAVSSGLASLIGQKAGIAINPQLQMLFQGIGFREYQMAFTFTPYSKAEAKQVDAIIKMFRKHAAPEIINGVGGAFFIPPSSFNVQFLFNGVENTHLNKVQESVITNIDVNYAPMGWAAYDDGEPVQTTLTIQFKELALVDKKQIEKGY